MHAIILCHQRTLRGISQAVTLLTTPKRWSIAIEIGAEAELQDRVQLFQVTQPVPCDAFQTLRS